eukprot:1141163-Pelagomonas_calceolata.AAC.3
MLTGWSMESSGSCPRVASSGGGSNQDRKSRMMLTWFAFCGTQLQGGSTHASSVLEGRYRTAEVVNLPRACSFGQVQQAKYCQQRGQHCGCGEPPTRMQLRMMSASTQASKHDAKV